MKTTNIEGSSIQDDDIDEVNESIESFNIGETSKNDVLEIVPEIVPGSVENGTEYGKKSDNADKHKDEVENADMVIGGQKRLLKESVSDIHTQNIDRHINSEITKISKDSQNDGIESNDSEETAKLFSAIDGKNPQKEIDGKNDLESKGANEIATDSVRAGSAVPELLDIVAGTEQPTEAVTEDKQKEEEFVPSELTVQHTSEYTEPVESTTTEAKSKITKSVLPELVSVFDDTTDEDTIFGLKDEKLDDKLEHNDESSEETIDPAESLDKSFGETCKRSVESVEGNEVPVKELAGEPSEPAIEDNDEPFSEPDPVINVSENVDTSVSEGSDEPISKVREVTEISEISETGDKSISKAGDEQDSDLAENPVAESIDELVSKAPGAIAMPISETSGTDERPVSNLDDIPVAEPADEPVSNTPEPSDEPNSEISDPVISEASGPTDKPISDLVDKPVTELVDEPANEPTNPLSQVTVKSEKEISKGQSKVTSKEIEDSVDPAFNDVSGPTSELSVPSDSDDVTVSADKVPEIDDPDKGNLEDTNSATAIDVPEEIKEVKDTEEKPVEIPSQSNNTEGDSTIINETPAVEKEGTSVNEIQESKLVSTVIEADGSKGSEPGLNSDPEKLGVEAKSDIPKASLSESSVESPKEVVETFNKPSSKEPERNTEGTQFSKEKELDTDAIPSGADLTAGYTTTPAATAITSPTSVTTAATTATTTATTTTTTAAIATSSSATPASAPSIATPAKPIVDTDTVYIYTSLTAGNYHVMPDTMRLGTILKANDIEYEMIDIATNERAKRIWKYRGISKGKKLPAVVRDDEVKGDIREIEDANEFGEVRELVYDDY